MARPSKSILQAAHEIGVDGPGSRALLLHRRRAIGEQEMAARNPAGTARCEMFRRPWTVDPRKTPALQLAGQVGQRHLRSVAAPAEHRVAVEHAPECNPIKST